MGCLFWGALLVLLSGNLGGLGYTTINQTFTLFDLISRLELFNQLPNYLGYFLLWLGFRRFFSLRPSKIRQAGLLLFTVIAPIQQYLEHYSIGGAAEFVFTGLNLAGQIFALVSLGLLAEAMHGEAGEPVTRRRTVTVTAVFLALSLPGLVRAVEDCSGVVGGGADILFGQISSVFRFARFLFAIWVLYDLHRTIVVYDRSCALRSLTTDPKGRQI
ncbi:MAG: hypothetical protein VB086_12615 [Clostridiaceae bacterium]|nr:hypothetical protein [Clostridiaceae bacterium]